MKPTALKLSPPSKFFIIHLPNSSRPFLAIDSEGDYEPSSHETLEAAREELETLRAGECLTKQNAYGKESNKQL